MVREIYIRNEEDKNFIPGLIEYSNEVESIISKVRMLLGTVPGDVLGDSDFGIDIEYLVFQTKESAADIKNELSELLNLYIPNTKNINFGKTAKGNDFGIIDVYINESKAIGFLVDKDNYV